MKRLTRLEVGAILIFGAGFAYLIGGEWYARQPEAQGANDMTTGAIATGTQLKREGEAVAELWAIRGIGERASDTVDLTHHLSPVKHLEVLGMLRELQPIDILGHHLPEQTGAWIDDLNSGAHISYQVAFPDGRIMPFTGWVQRVKVTGELAGAITFEATIRPVYAAPEYWHCLTDAPVGVPPSIGPDWEAILAPDGPSWWKCVVPVTQEHLMETPPPVEVLHHHWERFTFPGSEYYHCTGAPAAPGTRPDEDLEHWEPVDPPEGLEPGEAAFGNGGVSETWHIVDGYSEHGTEYPFASGDPIGSWIYPNIGWGDTLDGHGAAFAKCLSMFCVYDEDTKVPSKMRAYLKLISGAGTGESYAAVGLYKVGTPYTRVASSGWLRITNFDAMWVEFDVSDGAVALEEGAEYALIIATSEDAEHEPVSISVSDFEDYTPPNGAPWDDEEEYEYCQTVYLPPPDVVWYSWDPWDTYSLNDVVRYLPVYPEWEDDVQYKWCNWIHYKRPQ